MAEPGCSPTRARVIRMCLNRYNLVVSCYCILIAGAGLLPALSSRVNGGKPENLNEPVSQVVQVQSRVAASAIPDFGYDGLKDLTAEQRKRLFSGEVILVFTHEGAPEGQTIISAALIFEAPVEKTWSILADPERQAEYLEEIEELKIIEQGVDYNRMFFRVKVMGKKVSYTVIHHFLPEKYYFWWELDLTELRELKELYGFWKLHRLDEKRTVGRYGSLVRPSFPLSAFMRDWLSRSNIRTSLVKVKRYVESQSGN